MNDLATAVYAACLAAAAPSCVIAAHRARTLWGRRPPPARPLVDDVSAPTVLVQLPLYNEPNVAARAVRAVGALDWPRDRLRVQVLDDSDDGVTAREVDRAAAELRRGGVAVSVLRRHTRAGFKAGALAHGLALDDAPFCAVFDADFMPGADFLRRAMAYFDRDIDMVQCRWAHDNADESWLTRAQAMWLDAHFGVEQAGRDGAGRFFGFNGTAGIWRTEAIARAGGWDACTLTEDLDLALRAHVRGARFRYLDDVRAPAELPADVRALRRQQSRWTRGALQCARLRLPMGLRSRLPLGAKLDLTLKLTQNLSWVSLAALVLMLPVAASLPAPSPVWLAAVLCAFVVGAAPVVASLVIGARGRVRGARLVVDVGLALALASALALSNARAALLGLLSAAPAPFLRTPKRGAGSVEPLAASALAPYELVLGGVLLAVSVRAPMPLLWLSGAGLCALGGGELWGAARAAAQGRARRSSHSATAVDPKSSARGHQASCQGAPAAAPNTG